MPKNHPPLAPTGTTVPDARNGPAAKSFGRGTREGQGRKLYKDPSFDHHHPSRRQALPHRPHASAAAPAWRHGSLSRTAQLGATRFLSPSRIQGASPRQIWYIFPPPEPHHRAFPSPSLGSGACGRCGRGFSTLCEGRREREREMGWGGRVALGLVLVVALAALQVEAGRANAIVEPHELHF